VKALPVSVRFDTNKITLACYFPMPFFRNARFELVNHDTSAFTGIQWNFAPSPLLIL